MGLLDDVGFYLEAEGVGDLEPTSGLAADRTIWLGGLPDSPDKVVALIARSGLFPRRTFGEDVPFSRRPRLQTIVRSAEGDYPGAEQLAEDVYLALEKVVNGTLNGNFYLRIAAVHEPADVGVDDRNRPMLSCNFQVDRGV